jgi:hypothetical protein
VDTGPLEFYMSRDMAGKPWTYCEISKGPLVERLGKEATLRFSKGEIL